MLLYPALKAFAALILSSAALAAHSLTLTSPAFLDNGILPDQFVITPAYQCGGSNNNWSPPLVIGGVPSGTQSLAITVIDPDAPGGYWLHWWAWNIAPATTVLPYNSSVNASYNQGPNSYNEIGYGGPCPPTPNHHYPFKLYALNTVFQGQPSQSQLDAAMLATVTLTGMRSPNDHVTWTPPALPSCTLSAAPASISAGGSTTLTANCTQTPIAYVWTGGTCASSSASSCTVTLTSTTSFTVAGINASGTGSVAGTSVTVTGVAPPVCSLTASPPTIAAGGSSTLIASCNPAATSYIWTGGTCASATVSACSVTPLLTTNYTVAGVNGSVTGSAAGATVTVTPAVTGGTFTDPNTGLIWMRCALGQTWTGITCSGTATAYTSGAIMFNQWGPVTYEGQSDWRVPNARELNTIVDRTRSAPAIDITNFPNTPLNFFWEESRDIIDFASGQAMQISYIDSNIRLVRGGNSFTALLNSARPTSDYIDHGDGTITHVPTGLMWQRCSKGINWTNGSCSGSGLALSWSAASALTDNFAGKSDWRLPTIRELETLIDYTKSYPAINTAIFLDDPSVTFWSSTPYAYPSPPYAWSIDFSQGNIRIDPESSLRAVRFVRSNRPNVALNPTSINFPDQFVGITSPTKSVTLTNSGNGPLSILSILPSLNVFAVTHSCGNTLIAGGSCTLNITFTPTSNPLGTRVGAITIIDNAEGTPHSVIVSGVGVPNTLTAPSAPSITSIVAATGKLTIYFTPSSSNGGSPVVSYTATCIAGGQTTRSSTRASSPIVVSELVGGLTYSCRLIASNVSYSSTVSAAVSAKPTSANLTPILMLLLD